MVIIEAMDRHTDLGPIECGEMAEDIQAYIAWWGDGQLLEPGISVKGMPPEEDLAEFGEAVSRGRTLFNREKPVSCVYCHTADEPDNNYRRPLRDVFLGFPRSGGAGERAVSLDAYLLAHYRRQGVVMSAKHITDIAAYLAYLSRGKLQRPGIQQSGEETIQ
jgi:mono/diheme cytochrome c family protein